MKVLPAHNPHGEARPPRVAAQGPGYHGQALVLGEEAPLGYEVAIDEGRRPGENADLQVRVDRKRDELDVKAAEHDPVASEE